MDWAVHEARGRMLAYLRPSLVESWPRTAERFASVRSAILSGELEDALNEHGLTGQELVPKLALFQARYAEWKRLHARERRRGR